MHSSRTKKIGRPKKDPLRGGMAENSGFWQSALTRIGRNLVKRGATTPADWAEFSGKHGPWVMLKGIACHPAYLLLENAGAEGYRTFLAQQISKRPIVVPLYLGMILEEIARTPLLEKWLFYFPGRDQFSAADLSRRFESETGTRVSVAQVEQAVENLYRKVSRNRKRS